MQKTIFAFVQNQECIEFTSDSTKWFVEIFPFRFVDFANDSCIRDMTRKDQLKNMKTELMEFSHIFSFLNLKIVLKH